MIDKTFSILFSFKSETVNLTVNGIAVVKAPDIQKALKDFNLEFSGVKVESFKQIL